jgi:hypothetical protein
MNELDKVKDKILTYVNNGDLNSALIYIENYINEENKVKCYDVLCTMCDQLKGRIGAIESFGVTEDIQANVNAIIYASQRMDVKELQELAKIFKGQMDKVLYKEAVSGVCINPTIRDNVDYKSCEEGETYLKLHNLCAASGTVLVPPEEWKGVMREYCYRNKLSYPYSEAEDISYNPAAASGPAHIPVPVPAPVPAPGPVPQPYQAYPPPAGVQPSGYQPGVPAHTPTAPTPVLPPAGDLPQYGVPSPAPAPATSGKPAAGGDDDDEDLMARLRNLQD